MSTLADRTLPVSTHGDFKGEAPRQNCFMLTVPLARKFYSLRRCEIQGFCIISMKSMFTTGLELKETMGNLDRRWRVTGSSKFVHTSTRRKQSGVQKRETFRHASALSVSIFIYDVWLLNNDTGHAAPDIDCYSLNYICVYAVALVTTQSFSTHKPNRSLLR